MNDELLPCPCAHMPVDHYKGHVLKVVQRHEYAASAPPFSVLCICGAAGPLVATKDEAIEDWNRRAPQYRTPPSLKHIEDEAYDQGRRDQHRATAEAARERLSRRLDYCIDREAEAKEIGDRDSEETWCRRAESARLCEIELAEIRNSDLPPIRKEDGDAKGGGA